MICEGCKKEMKSWWYIIPLDKHLCNECTEKLEVKRNSRFKSETPQIQY